MFRWELPAECKCWEQTFSNKKMEGFCLFTLCFLFSASDWGEYSTNKSHICLQPDRDRLKVKNSRRPELISQLLAGNLKPVPLSSSSPGIRQLKQVMGWFKVRSARAAVLWPFSMFCFSLMLMTVKLQWPPASIHRVLTQPVYTSTQQKHNISWVGDKDTKDDTMGRGSL